MMRVIVSGDHSSLKLASTLVLPERVVFWLLEKELLVPAERNVSELEELSRSLP